MPIETTTHLVSGFCGDIITINDDGIFLDLHENKRQNITPNNFADAPRYMRELADLFTAAAKHLEEQE